MLWYELWEDADIRIWQPADEIADVRPLEYVSSGILTDCGHETDSPFHAIPKVPRIIHFGGVMGVDEGIDDTHHYDSILKASQKNLGDQVVEKMVSPW